MNSSLLQETNNRKQRLKQLAGQLPQEPPPPPQPVVAEEDTDVSNRSANSDLKRDLQRKLDQLQPQNEQAIADLIRKRIQGSNNFNDLAQVVNSK